MPIRIGINPLTWTNDDLPELGGDTPLETCLAEAKQAGYEGMELGNKFPRNPAELQPVMKEFGDVGLEVVSGWYSCNLLERTIAQERAALEPHLNLLRAMGSKVLVLCETTGSVQGARGTPVTKRPKLNEQQWQRLVEGLDALGDHCYQRGARLAYHFHMGTVVQTAGEIDKLMERCGPQVSLLLDTGHATYAGANPVTLALKYGARIAHVHAKDVRRPVLDAALKRDSSFLDAVLDGVFTVPGDGCVDFPAVFAALKAHAYQGWVVVEAEQDPKKADPLTYATMGYRNLTKYAAAVGL
ncbi:MAG: myo-inosose-2 dehydratase [Myxococcaceae bacterium]|nr:myo-inosose-2 dehydratase [Myxococcaceae bacterium]